MKIKDLKNATSSSGGKASGLALLNKIGVPVPEGFVINNTTEFEFTEENIAKIKEFLERLKEYGVSFKISNDRNKDFKLIKTQATISKNYYIKF